MSEANRDADDLQPGTQLAQYIIEDKLGEGTHGTVFAARQDGTGEPVAIKLLRLEYCEDEQMVSRFFDEAHAAARLDHPNIIRIATTGQHGQRHYLVMERLLGQSLEEHLGRGGRMDFQDALPILDGVANALDAAHAAGIIHRDLKAENVFLCEAPDGRRTPKLLDFGLAKVSGEISVHSTADGTQLGSAYYMSPQQCRGKKVDHRADLYALGVLIHRTLTSCMPFNGKSDYDTMYLHVSEEPPAMSSVYPQLPLALDAPVLKLLAKNPEDRYGTAREALQALRQAAGDAGVSVPEPGKSTRSLRVTTSRGNPSKLVAVVVAVALLAALGLWLLLT